MGEKRERVKQKLYDFICDEQYKPMKERLLLPRRVNIRNWMINS